MSENRLVVRKQAAQTLNSAPSVLFLNRVFPPSEGATGQLLSELSNALAEAGWRVMIVTTDAARPEHCKEGLGTDSVCSETLHPNIQIHRIRGLPFARERHWQRALSYFSIYPRFLLRALRVPKADVIVTMTDPPLLLVLGPVLKLLKRARLVHWAQDVYPEVAEELGILPKSGAVAGVLRGLSSWSLRAHDRIIAVGRCMKARLLERGIPASALRVIPNWADSPKQDDRNNEESIRFRQEHGLEGRFVVMYSGNFGFAHPFDAIIDAAEQLEKAEPHLLFVMVGSGPRLRLVKDEVARRSLGNVRFLPLQPRPTLGTSLAAADLHLVTMHDELCGLVVPSKIYNILAASRPCLFLGPKESEAAIVIQEQGCGAVISNANGEALAGFLVDWVGNSRKAEKSRQEGSEFKELGLERAAESFRQMLSELSSAA